MPPELQFIVHIVIGAISSLNLLVVIKFIYARGQREANIDNAITSINNSITALGKSIEAVSVALHPMEKRLDDVETDLDNLFGLVREFRKAYEQSTGTLIPPHIATRSKHRREQAGLPSNPGEEK